MAADLAGQIELAVALNKVINHNQDYVLILDLGSVDRAELRVHTIGKAYAPVNREPVIV